uniref:Adenosylhomocysteine nucleosidase n=1 Tax=Opuntia streptacantha TaxID=393608 RepID=A0A7C8Z7V7_OPUST
MAREMWGLKLVVMVLGLLVLAPETMQLHVDHPLHGVVQRINDKSGPFLAIIISSSRDERILLESGHFDHDQANPQLVIAGRRVHIGRFRGAPALVTRDEHPLANVAATAQALLDAFKIIGFIHYGPAGVVTDKINIGDVVVPESVALTGVWRWQEHESSLGSDQEELPSLRFGDYNLPKPGENKLGSVQHQRVTLYTPSGSNQLAFWLPVNRDWHRIASEIKGIMMEKCINGDMSTCVLKEGELIHEAKGASSDIYVRNEAYADFLQKLGADVVDTTSTAVVATAIANGVPNIVFRSAANKPGMEVDNEMKNVAARNVLQAVVKFVDLISPPMPAPRTSCY